jgi:hypothetical protein
VAALTEEVRALASGERADLARALAILDEVIARLR